MVRNALVYFILFVKSSQVDAVSSFRSTKDSESNAGLPTLMDSVRGLFSGVLGADGEEANNKVTRTTPRQLIIEGPANDQIQIAQWSKVIGSSECPSMFVVVMSKRDNYDTRAKIRKMWSQAHEGWGRADSKFGICKKTPASEPDLLDEKLKDESLVNNDILLLDCEEGYLEGLLTLKTIAAMSAFLSSPDERQLFMKTDDDTFVALPRLCRYLNSQGEQFKYSYIGVFAEDGERMDNEYTPCRDPESNWFEPWENYNGTYWPLCAKGGPGYILSRDLVQGVMETAPSKVLNNEDKAVGVWIDDFSKSDGINIRYANLPGTDGYLDFHEHIKTRGKWDFYPYVVHHHLNADEIACLYELQAKGDPNSDVDDCFTEHKAIRGLSRLSANRQELATHALKETYRVDRQRRTAMAHTERHALKHYQDAAEQKHHALKRQSQKLAQQKRNALQKKAKTQKHKAAQRVRHALKKNPKLAHLKRNPQQLMASLEGEHKHEQAHAAEKRFNLDDSTSEELLACMGHR